MNSKDPWGVVVQLETEFGAVKIGCGKNPDNERRLTKVQGEILKSQSKLIEYLSCIWLTPQMMGCFEGGQVNGEDLLIVFF